MKKLAILCLALAAVLVLSPAARADTYGYTISGATLNGWIDISVTSLGSGQYGIDKVWGDLTSPDFCGKFSSPTVGGYPAIYNDGLFAIDNVLTPLAAQVLDYWGLYFSDGGYNVNLWVQGSDYMWGDTGSFHDANPITLVATPEPGSLLLLGTGLMGVARLISRRRRHPVAG